MKKALITGGSGFAGAYLRSELLASGYGVVSTATGDVSGRGEGWKQLDITDSDAVKALLREGEFDCIFHLAAQSSAAISWKQPERTMEINVGGTLKLLDAIRSMEKPPRLLLTGSAEEYGPVKPEDCPLKEDSVCRPANPYAVSKLCAEQLAQVYAAAYGLEIICTRSFNHVGPKQGEGFVVSDFCRQIARLEKSGGEGVMKVGNLSARRDFSDVRDVVRAYRLLMERGQSGKVYNVGSGRALAVSELLERMLSLSTGSIRAETDPGKLRPVDVPLHVADITSVTADTGWKPEIPLETTLQETLNYWREKLGRE